jgi:RNA ligase-like protein
MTHIKTHKELLQELYEAIEKDAQELGVYPEYKDLMDFFYNAKSTLDIYHDVITTLRAKKMSDPNRAAAKAEKEAAKQVAITKLKEGLPKFQEWPKIGRLNRDILVTEKLDGTNAAIGIVEEAVQVAPPTLEPGVFTDLGTFKMVTRVYAQSRTRIITPLDDNAGFAAWVEKNQEVLIRTLGPGLHFGEWWGVSIGRGYGMSERRFSLFNTARWTKPEGAAALEQARKEGVAIYTVPVLYNGPWTGMLGYIDGTQEIAPEATALPWLVLDEAQKWPEVEGQQNPRPRFAPNFILEWLARVGSQAAPGFMKPEGIVVYHRGSDALFKATIENDEKHKFEV